MKYLSSKIIYSGAPLQDSPFFLSLDNILNGSFKEYWIYVLLKSIIQYEGTNYVGFQWQNGIQTIQSEFSSATSKLIDGKFSTTAASRTDTGVHALEQIMNNNLLQTFQKL